ncbi:MAG TPA: response regulator [Bryobacteraceae bacterium]|jgi:DNA-binding response OmpR family regulator
MPADAPNSPIGILSISPTREDHAAVRGVCHGASYQVATAETCHQALRRLIRGGISVVVCERELPDGGWHDVLHGTQSLGSPLLVVTSRLADDRLWAEVLNLGGFDVIAKPFVESELRRVLESACRRTQA